ncbi:MAG: hypothetical protein AB8B60_02100 [Sulfitobacter sp.]
MHPLQKWARLIEGMTIIALILIPVAIVSALLIIPISPDTLAKQLEDIAVYLDSEMFFFAAAGGLIIITGWAMREASDLASENRAFV